MLGVIRIFCGRDARPGVSVGCEPVEATDIRINIYDHAFVAKVDRIVSSPRHQSFESMWGVAHP